MIKINHHALVLSAAFLIGASCTNLRAAVFSDDNWTGMGGYPGANDSVRASLVDGSGHLYIGGDFTIAGGAFANNIAKWDGTNWSALGSGVNAGVTALARSGNDLIVAGHFTTAGGAPASRIAKWDGSQWSALGSGVNGSVSKLVVSGGNLYAAAADGVAISIVRWDGNSWSPLGSGIGKSDGLPYVSSLAPLGGDLYVGGSFTTAGGIAATNIARWNGSSWSALGSGVQRHYLGNPNAYVSALAVSENELYVAGQFSTAGGVAATNMARWNGSSWSAFPWMLLDENGQALWGNVNDLTFSGNDLYAAGLAESDISGSSYSGYVAKWNGSSWSRLAPEMNGSLYDAWDPVVYTVAVSGSTLYAGGAFQSAGNRTASCIAQWNGNDWSPLSPKTSVVTALAASGNEAYAAGHFTVAGLGSNYIGKWNGSGWSPLGSGAIYNVTDLAMSGSELYAAGTFTNVGITANIAKWNGSNWSPLGSGVNGTVYALAVLGKDVYAAGSFTTAGGIAATNIAKWNGTNWSGLGWAAVSYRPVYALAVLGNDLYAGGAFSVADGAPGHYIAKWDGSSWSALGSGVTGFVQALAVLGGDLYVGGDFTTAGGVTVQCIAKWNGNNWSALGSGMTRSDWGPDGEHHSTPHVRALAVSGHHLYAGGYFNTAGDADANYIARWDGSNWSGLGSGTDYGVLLMAASGPELFVGGSFTLAGGKISPSMARARIGSAAQGITTSSSAASIRFSGVTGYPYDVQRATQLIPPITWTTVSDAPLYPAADGSFTFTDTNASPANAFYRLRNP